MTYVDHGKGSPNDEPFTTVLHSLTITKGKTLTISKETYTFTPYSDPGTTPIVGYMDSSYELPIGNYNIFDTKEVDGTTWYMIGPECWTNEGTVTEEATSPFQFESYSDDFKSTDYYHNTIRPHLNSFDEPWFHEQYGF